MVWLRSAALTEAASEGEDSRTPRFSKSRSPSVESAHARSRPPPGRSLRDPGLSLIEGAPATSVLLLLFLIPVAGIVATTERIHRLLVVIAAGLSVVNFARL